VVKTITIGIPTFNRRNKLLSLLQQVISLQERIPQIKVIVSDNGSTDSPLSDLEELVKTGKIAYLQSEKNYGIAANQEKIVRHCSTDYLWLVSDDDLIDVDQAERYLTKNLNQDYCLMACNYGAFSDESLLCDMVPIGPRVSKCFNRAADVYNEQSVGHFSAFIYHRDSALCALDEMLSINSIEFYNKMRGLFSELGLRICNISDRPSFYWSEIVVFARRPQEIDYDGLKHLCVDFLMYSRYLYVHRIISVDDFEYRKKLVKARLIRSVLADLHRYSLNDIRVMKVYFLNELIDLQFIQLYVRVMFGRSGKIISFFTYQFYCYLVEDRVLKMGEKI
jgi:glycosyltransferase involved in cell wall biosynthesis